MDSDRQVWHFIDFPAGLGALARQDLSAMAELWANERSSLEHRDEYKRFHERLIRSWSIETGILERAYDIDRGTTELLIQRGFDESVIEHGSTSIPATRLIQILKDHRNAVEHVMHFVQGRRTLSTGFIKELHQLLMRSQATVTVRDAITGDIRETELKLGEFKRHPNNPSRPDGSIVAYCPPEHTPAEVDRLVLLYNQNLDIAPDVLGAWLHHRFTQIHPFQDGNGRVARALAALVFIKQGLLPPVITREHRAEYLDALEEADVGDLRPLIELLADREVDALRRALSEPELLAQENADVASLMKSARHRLAERTSPTKESSKALLKLLADECDASLIDLHQQLVVAAGDDVRVSVVVPQPGEQTFYSQALALQGDRQGFRPGLNNGRDWRALHVEAPRGDNDVVASEVVVVLCEIDRASGSLLVGATAIARVDTAKWDRSGRGIGSSGDPLLEGEFFTAPLNEPEDSVRSRFRAWLDRVWRAGLAYWHDRI